MKSLSNVFDSLRRARGVPVVGLGPLIGRSPAWGQRILDGSCTPKMADALALLRVLGASQEQVQAVLTDLWMRLLRQQGFSDRCISQVYPLIDQAVALIVADSQ